MSNGPTFNLHIIFFLEIFREVVVRLENNTFQNTDKFKVTFTIVEYSTKWLTYGDSPADAQSAAVM